MKDGAWERVAASYIGLQGLAVLGWWAWLFSTPEPWPHFVGPELPMAVLRIFFVADLVVYVLLGAVLGFLLLRQKPRAAVVLPLRIGGEVYATLATFGLAYESGGGWFGAGLMTASTAVSIFLAARLRR